MTILVVLLMLLIAWPVGLLVWANGKIQHTEALSGAPNTPGTTYLLAGSDSRADGAVADPTEGQRSDTIMVMHVPASGPAALISLPRDTLVEIPGGGLNKLNAAYSQGGAPLLVETVEGLTGLTMDHYVEIGMGGVRDVVDAVGGVNLCLDYDVVHDEFSGLEWVAGCHDADGTTALAFARMRYSDPQGDIGRGQRQRQVIGAVVKEVAKPATLVNPVDQVQLIDAGTNALVVDTDTGIIDLARMALAFRGATGPDGIVGAPPIASMDYRPGGGLGSTVLLDQEKAPVFFQKLRDGELTAADVETP
ncbi:LCP family protein [Georgenia yuyongxinii]|uniref:LCP family protein n=1 Tax=Georgenia yuyongxinii TaxID=2589797 RepID=UPI001E3ED750|nr:LCP family protein [Georgenia yuyongxinii]